MIVYSKYKDKQIDTDYEEEYDIEDIVFDYINSDDFKDSLYDQCNFGVEWDDYRKWAVIEDWPDSEDFYEDLIEFTEEEIGRKLEEEEKEELIEYFEDRWSDIIDDLESDLIERHNDSYDDYPEYD